MPDPRSVAPYDALLLVSFGGPERPEDVLPFLENVTRGRGIPPERLAEVGRALLRRSAAAARSTTSAGRSCPRCGPTSPSTGSTSRSTGATATGTPTCATPWREMAADGVRRAAAFVTSAYSSYSGCRQYRENLFDAVDGPRPRRRSSTSCGTTSTTRVSSRPTPTRRSRPSRRLPERERAGARLVFVTHSIPTSDGRRRRARTAAPTRRSTAARPAWSPTGYVRRPAGRSSGTWSTAAGPGSPRTPWLEPDVNDHLASAARGRRRRRSWSSRSASSPTTWRSSTTWTPRPPPRPRGSG